MVYTPYNSLPIRYLVTSCDGTLLGVIQSRVYLSVLNENPSQSRKRHIPESLFADEHS